MTLDDVRTIGPHRAVSDAELLAALAWCQQEDRKYRPKLLAGELTRSPHYDEMQRILSTYTGWATRNVVENLSRAAVVEALS